MKKIVLTFLLAIIIAAPLQTRAATVSYVVGDIPQMIKEYVGDTLINVAVSKTIGSITGSITNWANSGFKGKPAFITDLKKTMGDLEGTVVSGLLNEIENTINKRTGGTLDLDGFFCGPFDREIRNSLRIQLAVKSAKAPFTNRSKCTIDSILEKAGNTLNDFEGDFSKGGWPAWLELTEPENNRWGAISLSYKEIWKKDTESKETKKVEVANGRGFLSQRKPMECLDNPNGMSGPDYGEHGWPLNAKTKDEECPPEFQKTPESWVTPGAVISNKVSEALGLANSKLVGADEINEMLGALINGLMQKAFETAGGMLGLSDSTNGDSELKKMEDQQNERGDAMEEQALATAEGAVDRGSATMDALKKVQEAEDKLEACQIREQMNQPDPEAEVNVNVTTPPPDPDDSAFLFGARVAYAFDENGDGIEDDEGNLANCADEAAALEAARTELKALMTGNVAAEVSAGIEGGAGENPFQCRFIFSGESASRDVNFSRSGSFNGFNAKDSFYKTHFLIPAETNKFYGTLSLSFDADAGAMPINNIVGLSVSQKGNFYNGMQMGITTNLRNTRWDNNAYAGGPNYFGNGRTAWTRDNKYRVEINFESKTNTLRTKITNKTTGAVAGNFSIAGALASGDIAPPDGNFKIVFGGTDWTYSNVSFKATPGGPYGEGMPGKCGLPGGVPMGSGGGQTPPPPTPTTTPGPGPTGDYPGAENRYVREPDGSATLLAGAYTGHEFQNNVFNSGISINYDSYLQFLANNNMNFTRLWREETTGNVSDSRYSNPMPYGGSRGNYNLNQWNDAYFTRMVDYVQKAESQGIWTGVMLFNGWSVSGGEDARRWSGGNITTWFGHPFNRTNNTQSFSGDSNNDDDGFETQSLTSGPIWDRQVAYVNKVIDTLNGFDRVIWEISNEGPGGQNEENSNAWQVAMKNHIKQYEASKPKQHKIQISSGFGMSNSFTDPTLNSGDIYSPTINPGQLSNSAPGVRMGLLDTDHGNADAFESDNSKVWVWKNFMRGYNFVINGDFSSGTVNYSNYLPESTEIISAFRQVRALSERVNLVALSPVNAECSSGYCLGSLTEVIAYSDTPSISINMGARAGTFRVEVIDPGNGTILSTGTFTAGTGTTYTSAGGSGPRVFYLKKQ